MGQLFSSPDSSEFPSYRTVTRTTITRTRHVYASPTPYRIHYGTAQATSTVRATSTSNSPNDDDDDNHDLRTVFIILAVFFGGLLILWAICDVMRRLRPDKVDTEAATETTGAAEVPIRGDQAKTAGDSAARPPKASCPTQMSFEMIGEAGVPNRGGHAKTAGISAARPPNASCPTQTLGESFELINYPKPQPARLAPDNEVALSEVHNQPSTSFPQTYRSVSSALTGPAMPPPYSTIDTANKPNIMEKPNKPNKLDTLGESDELGKSDETNATNNRASKDSISPPTKAKLR